MKETRFFKHNNNEDATNLVYNHTAASLRFVAASMAAVQLLHTLTADKGA